MGEIPPISLKVLPYWLAVCRLPPESPLPAWTSGSRFLSLTVTAEELSLVCEESLIPPDIPRESGWRALKVDGPLAFELTGVLSSLLSPLAQAGISIFALSTFDTDYILVKAACLNQAVEALRRAGHQVNSC
jgi:hypothetical protein